MKYIRDGKEVEPELIKTCVLYDRDTGHIVHVHKVVSLPSGRPPASDHVEKRAMELAAQGGRDVSKLKALHVSATEWDESYPHRVDPRSGRLERLPPLPGKRSS